MKTADRESLLENHGKRWEPEDDKMLVRCLQEGGTVESIANEMGRTEGSILARMESIARNIERFNAAKKVICG